MLDVAAVTLAQGLTGGLLLLIVCATILALLSQRNGHLSDRAREVRKRFEDSLALFEIEFEKARKKMLFERLINLKRQNELFIERYVRTALALRVTVGAFGLFILASWLSLFGKSYPIAVGLDEIVVIGGAVRTHPLKVTLPARRRA